MVFASLLEYACVSFLGLVKPTMMKTGRQQQQPRYQPHRPVRQSRDYLFDTTSGSQWDPAARSVFITDDTRTDNGPTFSQGSVPPVSLSTLLVIILCHIITYHIIRILAMVPFIKLTGTPQCTTGAQIGLSKSVLQDNAIHIEWLIN